MRDIIFRGKRKDNGEWVEGYFCGKNNETFFSPAKESAQIIDKDLYWHEVIPETVGQYTGLTDKNGKKIFEGDIVSHYINWLGKRVNAVVKYNIKVASWVCEFFNNDKESAFLADWVNGNGCEVIGNIHDNPELLKEGEEE